MIGNIVVYIILAIVLADIIIMSVYCRFMSVLDKKRMVRRKQIEAQRISEGVSVSQPKKKLIKRIIIYLIDHYIYGLMRYSVIVVGKIPSGFIRNILYRFVFCMKITKRTVIYGGCEIRSPWNFTADNCVVSNNCLLDCRNEIKFGQNVVLGAGVHIWTEQHDVNSPTFKVTERNRGPVVVGDRAWICSDTTILPNVNVGEGAVLASRACATKNLEPFGVYAGIPAKKISERNKDLVYELNGKSHWKFY